MPQEKIFLKTPIDLKLALGIMIKSSRRNVSNVENQAYRKLRRQQRLPCIRRKTVRRTVSVTKTGNASDYEK